MEEDTEMEESDAVENPKASQKSSSDSESSDSEEEADQNEQLLALEYELSTNPSNYDAHVQYIKLLRRSAEIEKLREARENMNTLFPLSPEMWMEWAKDEASLSNDSNFESVEKLYERGISEYLSIPLWCEYLNYVQEHDPKVRDCLADGISKARNLFERAVTAAALHVSQGSQIWDAYIQYEQAILLTIDQSDIQKAEEMYNAHVHHEEQITRQDISESERFQHYMSYLDFEKSFGDPARVQILYERAITDFPVSNDLWLHYTHYLDKTLKVGNVVKDVYSRATRNCPWVGELWVRYLLCLERGLACEKEISAAFEKSLKCTFSTLEEYLDLFLTRVDGLRRRISSASGDGVLNYSMIRESFQSLFQQAADYLSPHMKNTDGLLHLHAYWARLELKLGNDLIAARGVWESLLKTCGSMLEAWKSYIAMEIELDHINEARAIYKRCYSKRFSGTSSEVTPRLEELQLFRLQQESKSFTGATDQREETLKNTSRERRKSGSSAIDEQPPAKWQKYTSQNKKLHKKENTQGLNLAEANDGEEKEGKVEKKVNEKQMKDTKNTTSRLYKDQCTAFVSNLNITGLAYVDFKDDVHLAAAVAKNKQMFLGKKLSVARSNPKQGKRESLAHTAPGEEASNQSGGHGRSVSKESGEDSKGSRGRKRVENIQLKGKNTFAVPRNVKPLGWTNKPGTREEEDEKPKSNDEFRKMFMKT
ncbi:hypothetical protein GOBAR_AA28295 [Gossypium barbadense]|uniref:LSM-interacting domain-containing protein n=1 Tax=Gossypium barbadense TaxID=3634 RepID=A0A2P5WMQ0_GOSBA|nr:hypothetical protein GOBAR_AA28295 [Gossypium barbadense]